MFISPAYAQAAGGAGGGLEALFPLVLIFVVFYFLLIRPQQKKAKEHKAMLEAVRRGDKVVTGGGIVGNVTKVIDDNEVMVEIAEGVKVRVQRSMIAAILSKTEPVKGDKDKDGKKNVEISAPANDAGTTESGVSKLKGLLGLK